ncbi:putative S-adenosylmethionine-dependent methyltransferase [Prunus yedoensis var. nudiflora]|uniref:Putative S-adenosylmethionine-dependent methyltransferase n=1 Tax=Prunus yedoensis var. nudiflora TaxID=2094558 RepID=A0A314ZE67_PRUYE|nr:putative S-adenosylmethionine-dependent methyltransferase [Prunus yedoensis var. nudiflora]
MSPQEVEAAVQRNGEEILDELLGKGSSNIILEKKILDELFNLYQKKLEEQPSAVESGKSISFLVELKRKA